MRILIDLQGAQSESRFRGIGRYNLSLVQAMARHCGEHELFLALNGRFPRSIAPIRAALDGLLPPERIRVWQAPGPLRALEPGNAWRRAAAARVREAFIADLEPDVVLIGSLFEGYVDDAVLSIGQFETRIPVAVILYDLIPLLNPGRYLKPNPRFARYYQGQLEAMQKASLLLAISESARAEGAQQLGEDIPIVNISCAADPAFCPAPAAETPPAPPTVSGVQRPFVLYSGGSDERKNLPRLLLAFAMLGSRLRQTHQLVLAGRMPAGDREQLLSLARSLGLQADDLVLTGYISDHDLLHLYRACTLFVLPSWHEGFGLPALEAMACGAPVIAANATSLPEVVGLDEALFDPLDPPAIAAKLTQALDDDAFRARLREHGLRQAQRFSWDTTAQRALAALARIVPESESTAPPARTDWRAIRQRQQQRYQHLIHQLAALAGPAPSDAALVPLAQCIEHNQRQAEAVLRATVLPEQLHWRLEGPFDSSYSLALVNRESARALADLGLEVALHSTEGPGDFAPDPAFLAANPDLATLHRRAATSAALDAHVLSRNLYPPRVQDMEARFNLLHAYGWEESAFPSDWVEAFNEHLQGLTLVSEAVRKIM
ncbi:MAG: glycosyltransferase family 4 protein, partial [Halochromatium sp.]